LQQWHGGLGGLLGTGRSGRLDAETGQEGAGVIETGSAITEAIKARIQGGQQGLQLLNRQLRQRFGARLGRRID
jgi:hypothetical protein